LGAFASDIILFIVSSKQRRLEAPNVAVNFTSHPFTTYEKTSFTESASRSFMKGFSSPKRFGGFRETGHRPEFLGLPHYYTSSIKKL